MVAIHVGQAHGEGRQCGENRPETRLVSLETPRKFDEDRRTEGQTVHSRGDRNEQKTHGRRVLGQQQTSTAFQRAWSITSYNGNINHLINVSRKVLQGIQIVKASRPVRITSVDCKHSKAVPELCHRFRDERQPRRGLNNETAAEIGKPPHDGSLISSGKHNSTYPMDDNNIACKRLPHDITRDEYYTGKNNSIPKHGYEGEQR